MLNENRFLGTFRGHNTRTIWKTLLCEIVGGRKENFTSCDTMSISYIYLSG